MTRCAPWPAAPPSWRWSARTRRSTACKAFVCDTDELVLALPAGHALSRVSPVPFEEALEHDFVALGRSTSLMRQISAAAEAAGRTLKIRVQVRSFDAMCRMVAAGLGVAILPRAGAAPHVASMGLHLAALAGVRTERKLLMVMRDRDRLSPAARALVDMLQPPGAGGADGFRTSPAADPSS